jgi:hypothetical protein
MRMQMWRWVRVCVETLCWLLGLWRLLLVLGTLPSLLDQTAMRQQK